MRKVLVTVIISLIVLFLAWPLYAAQSAGHKVVRGECLSKIAKQYGLPLQAILKMNRIKDPNKIYPGQTIHIPGSAHGLGKKVKKPFYWDWMNGKPFGPKRDFAKGIRMYNDEFDPLAKEQIINLIITGQGEDHVILPGDHFEQMLSGNYHVIDDVTARFAKDKIKDKPAKKYCATVGDTKYCVAKPACFNWPWWKEKIAPAPKPEPEPKKVIVPEPTPEIAPTPTPAPELPAETPPPPAAKGFCLECNNYTKSYLYVGYIGGLQSENHSDWTRYYGINFFDAPCPIYVWEGWLRVGPVVEFTGWEGGIDHDNIRYRGHMLAYGGEIQHERSDAEDMIRIMYAEKSGDVWADSFQYDSNESTHILIGDAGHQWWYNRTWFNQFEFRIHVEWDFDKGARQKDSYLNGQKFDERPLDQSVYTVSFKTEYYKNGDWALTAENTVGYLASNYGLFDDFRLGAKWKNMVEPVGSFRWNEFSGNEQWGAHLILNLTELAIYGWDLIEAKWRESHPENTEPVEPQHAEDFAEKKLNLPKNQANTAESADSDATTLQDAGKTAETPEKLSRNDSSNGYVVSVLKDNREAGSQADNEPTSIQVKHLVDNRSEQPEKIGKAVASYLRGAANASFFKVQVID